MVAGVLCLLLAVVQGACGGPTSFDGVYEETGVAGSNRSHALRLTLFEFSGDVGGHVQFYRIGPGANPPDNPYFRPEKCAFFGPGPRRAGEFLIDLEGLDGVPLVARVSQEDGADRVVATLTTTGGLTRLDDPEAAISLPSVLVFERQRGEQAEGRCRPEPVRREER